MVDRIKITTPTFMQVDGQWTIVDSGSVIDVPLAAAYKGAATTLSPSESAGALASHGGPTSVRDVKKR